MSLKEGTKIALQALAKTMDTTSPSSEKSIFFSIMP
jgi:hypothetical protein